MSAVQAYLCLCEQLRMSSVPVYVCLYVHMCISVPVYVWLYAHMCMFSGVCVFVRPYVLPMPVCVLVFAYMHTNGSICVLV